MISSDKNVESIGQLINELKDYYLLQKEFVQLDIIDKAGAWFTVGEQRIQGRDAVKQYLLENPEVSERIEQEIRDNAWKLMSPQARRAAQATGRAAETAVDISAADFDEG